VRKSSQRPKQPEPTPHHVSLVALPDAVVSTLFGIFDVMNAFTLMDALKARFGDHTDALFKRHGMKSIGYWQPEDAPSSQELFIYLLEHPSRRDADKNWAAFQADPEWQKVKAESEIHGSLVDRIDRYFMDPTPYSALK